MFLQRLPRLFESRNFANFVAAHQPTTVTSSVNHILSHHHHILTQCLLDGQRNFCPNVISSNYTQRPLNYRCASFLSKKSKKAKEEDDDPPTPSPPPQAKMQSAILQETLKKIEKDFGKDAIMKLGAESRVSLDAISTGSLGLDVALGIGGLPRGRVVEIYGPESSGKTTVTLHTIAEAQKLKGTCTFIDAEHALDIKYAKGIGVNTDELYVCQPSYGEQALEIADTLIKSGTMDVIVVDSVAALIPKAELEGEMGDHHIGSHARLMSQALRKLTQSLASNPRCLLIFTNQIRMKIGVMFGSPEVTTGGNALKFFSSVRLDTRKVAHQKKGDLISGLQVKVTVTKNKVAPPFRTAVFDVEFGKGVSKSGEIIDMGVACGVIEKSGSWYSYGSRQLAQGRDKVKIVLEQDEPLAVEIEQKVRTKILTERVQLEDTPDHDHQQEGASELGLGPEL